jgi:hypothetical protein
MFISKAPPKDPIQISNFTCEQKVALSLLVAGVLLALAGGAALWGALDPACPLGVIGHVFKKGGSCIILAAGTTSVAASVFIYCKS